MSKKTLSEAQLAANRANAQKSTGPRSIEGKARSSRNSWNHGLTGATGLLPSDDRDAYELYVDGIVDSLHPGSLLEHEICRDVADAHWRLRRVSSVEAKMLMLPAVPPTPEKSVPVDHYEPINVPLSDEPPYRTREDDLHTAARICLDRPTALTNIALYEQRIHRGIKHSMDELRRLQSEREARHKPEMSAAVDRYKERRMRNLPLDLEADGFVFSIDEVRAALHTQIRETEVQNARDCGFSRAKYEERYGPKVA